MTDSLTNKSNQLSNTYGGKKFRDQYRIKNVVRQEKEREKLLFSFSLIYSTKRNMRT